MVSQTYCRNKSEFCSDPLTFLKPSLCLRPHDYQTPWHVADSFHLLLCCTQINRMLHGICWYFHEIGRNNSKFDKINLFMLQIVRVAFSFYMSFKALTEKSNNLKHEIYQPLFLFSVIISRVMYTAIIIFTNNSFIKKLIENNICIFLHLKFHYNSLKNSFKYIV